jgi:hypothetical protein
MRPKLRWRGAWIVAASLAGLALAGGVAYATIPDAAGVIHTCYKPGDATKVGGASLSVVDSESGGTCKTGDTALTFNQQGPQGRQGERGPSDAYSMVLVGEGKTLSTGVNTPITHLDVPSGSAYAVSGTVEVSNEVNGGTVYGGCQLASASVDFSVPVSGKVIVSLTGAWEAGDVPPIVLRCQVFSGDTLRFSNATITAVTVETLHFGYESNPD